MSEGLSRWFSCDSQERDEVGIPGCDVTFETGGYRARRSEWLWADAKKAGWTRIKDVDGNFDYLYFCPAHSVDQGEK